MWNRSAHYYDIPLPSHYSNCFKGQRTWISDFFVHYSIKYLFFVVAWDNVITGIEHLIKILSFKCNEMGLPGNGDSPTSIS